MPYFQLMLSGDGVSIPFQDSPVPVIGFFTTRIVKADDLASATATAKAVILEEWTSGEYAAQNAGSPPNLQVESSHSIGFLKGLLGRRPKGYTFFTSND